MYKYPFGQEVKRLVQKDQTPKKVFVLGVYASAVHAKWIRDGKIICQALAVASEPYIFWDGNPKDTLTIINQINIPEGLGKLVLPNSNLNGPSAKVLVENILKPMGYSRSDAWLCDLLPESRLNPNQLKVIQERYNPLVEKYGLNKVTVPIEDGHFSDEIRAKEITVEILKSQADTVILLGDIPIQQYLKYECSIEFKSLREYTQKHGYGTPLIIKLGTKEIEVILLTHPRQIGGLGRSSTYWSTEHKIWEISDKLYIKRRA
jgi:hypothetical protein